jgi:hypothetical protein
MTATRDGNTDNEPDRKSNPPIHIFISMLLVQHGPLHKGLVIADIEAVSGSAVEVTSHPCIF